FKGHALFQVNNHTANRVVKGILASPAHRMLSDRMLILTVTGRRTGKRRTFPVAYQQDGDTLTLHVDWPERKVWWRNLIGGALVVAGLGEVELALAGQFARRGLLRHLIGVEEQAAAGRAVERVRLHHPRGAAAVDEEQRAPRRDRLADDVLGAHARDHSSYGL